MEFRGLKNVWELLRNFDYRDLLVMPKMLTRNPDDVTSPNDVKNFGDIKAYTNRACAYADLGKPFDSVLFTGQKMSTTIVKKLENCCCALTLQSVLGNSKLFEEKDTATHDSGLALKINGTVKMAGMIKPFFMVSKDNFQIGMNIKPHDLISIGAGVEKKYDVYKKLDNVLQTSLSVNHPSVVLDAKIELSQNQPGLMGLNMKLSSVYYHQFENFGIAIGFDLMKDFAYYISRRRYYCQGLSISLVRPSSTIYRFTVEPRELACTFDGYWQLNDSLAIASGFKLNWADYRGVQSLKHSVWRQNEVGLKYRHSENVSFGIKSNLIGDVTAGAWLNTLCNVATVVA